MARSILGAVALAVGLTAATGHNVAWAEGPNTDGQGGPTNQDVSLTGPKKGTADTPGTSGATESDAPKLPRLPKLDLSKLDLPKLELPKLDVPKLDAVKLDVPKLELPKLDVPKLELPKLEAPKFDLPKFPAAADSRVAQVDVAAPTAPQFKAPAINDLVRATKPLLGDLTGIKLPTAELTKVVPQAGILSTGSADALVTTTTTPEPPQELSPLAKLMEAPARLVNTVLQALDFTISSTGPKSPFDWNPIDEAVWAVFRRAEDFLGLNKTPTDVPEPTKQVYSCETEQTCDQKTPTVAQFLNAATAEYVLGGQPGDLKPFVVNGKQMKSTNTLTGMSASAWVTPDNQIIIAYSGTTGGTNLLANPVIAVTQVLADMQVIVTPTTPMAFYDSLTFANQVRQEAYKQGYTDDDIFVTGHSLGAWEAQYVAQQTGLGGVGFEGPGLNTINPNNSNGDNSNFVNVLTYGDAAAYFSSDVPGLEPVMGIFPGGDNKPHYGNIVMIGNPTAADPMINAAAMFGPNPIYDVIFVIDTFGNFMQYHLPGVQAYHLGVDPDPGVVPWLGNTTDPASNTDWGNMTIPQLQQAASDEGVLFT